MVSINSMEFLSDRKARKFIFNLKKMRINSNYYLQCKITYRCIKNTVKIIGIKSKKKSTLVISTSVLCFFNVDINAYHFLSTNFVVVNSILKT